MIINFGKILNLIVFDVIANLYFNVKINSAKFYRVDVGCDFFESKGVVCHAQKRGVGFGTKQNIKAEFVLCHTRQSLKSCRIIAYCVDFL